MRQPEPRPAVTSFLSALAADLSVPPDEMTGRRHVARASRAGTSGRNGVGFARLDSFQSGDQPFDGAKLISATAEGAHHLLKERRVIGGHAPRAVAGALLRGERGGERIAKFG